MPVNGFDVFDADGHVLELDDELIEYYEGDLADKKRMKTIGSVDIPQSAFVAVLKTDTTT